MVAAQEVMAASVPAAHAVKTLYLVRHGEAVHNVEEQRAQRLAAAEAEAQGHLEGGGAHKAAMEAARKAALRNERLRDAELSATGRRQTLAASEHLRGLSAGPYGLPEPEAVFVSPLQRTLETAAILFPEHPRVCVQEELRERRTGLPCDERKAASYLARQPSFSNMDFSGLLCLDGEAEGAEAATGAEVQRAELEDGARLRLRTARLAEALWSVDCSVLCLVTHKAFLRELERGPLGQPEACQFGNCEVRAYEVALMPDGSLAASLLHSDEKPWQGPPSPFTSEAADSDFAGAASTSCELSALEARERSALAAARLLPCNIFPVC